MIVVSDRVFVYSCIRVFVYSCICTRTHAAAYHVFSMAVREGGGGGEGNTVLMIP